MKENPIKENCEEAKSKDKESCVIIVDAFAESKGNIGVDSIGHFKIPVVSKTKAKNKYKYYSRKAKRNSIHTVR